MSFLKCRIKVRPLKSELESNLLGLALDEIRADEPQRWAEIKRRYFAHSHRTNVDIKDRYKYVCRQQK